MPVRSWGALVILGIGTFGVVIRALSIGARLGWGSEFLGEIVGEASFDLAIVLALFFVVLQGSRRGL